MNTVISNYDDYISKVYSSEIPENQQTELRRAFFAGAVAVLNINRNISSMSESGAVAVLEGLDQELIQFRHDVISDKA